VSNNVSHRPWCTDHLSEDPTDPLTAGADECGAVVLVLPPNEHWQGVSITASQAPDDAVPVLTVESSSRPMTSAEARRLYTELGRLLELLDAAEEPAAYEPPDPRPIATDEHGWPMLNPEGTAWERHDDPEADR
jgi:hypothetical protein